MKKERLFPVWAIVGFAVMIILWLFMVFLVSYETYTYAKTEQYIIIEADKPTDTLIVQEPDGKYWQYKKTILEKR